MCIAYSVIRGLCAISIIYFIQRVFLISRVCGYDVSGVCRLSYSNIAFALASDADALSRDQTV